MAEEKLIGTINHYYDNIGVAVIDLKSTLTVGETIRIAGGENDFTQDIDSMEVDYKKIDKAKSGDSVGVKVGQKVREGYRVYKI